MDFVNSVYFLMNIEQQEIKTTTVDFNEPAVLHLIGDKLRKILYSIKLFLVHLNKS